MSGSKKCDIRTDGRKVQSHITRHSRSNKAKVNVQYYLDKVLRPLLEKELPKLDPGDLHKVTVHHDSIFAHCTFDPSLRS